jgi:hypothetical protein
MLCTINISKYLLVNYKISFLKRKAKATSKKQYSTGIKTDTETNTIQCPEINPEILVR